MMLNTYIDQPNYVKYKLLFVSLVLYQYFMQLNRNFIIYQTTIYSDWVNDLQKPSPSI